MHVSKTCKIILTYFFIVVNYDEKGNKTTIFDKFKPTIDGELYDVLDLLGSEDVSGATTDDLLAFVDGMAGADKSV